MIAESVYVLCALLSITCAVCLFRGYRASRTMLLFYSSLCFFGLALNNVLLFIDLVVFPGPVLDLSLWRGASALASMSILIFGLVWESR